MRKAPSSTITWQRPKPDCISGYVSFVSSRSSPGAGFADVEGDFMELPDTGRVQCLLCGKDYSSKRKAKVHILTLHRAPNDKSLQSKCDLCGKIYKHEINMRDHLYKVHHIRRRQQKQENDFETPIMQ